MFNKVIDEDIELKLVDVRNDEELFHLIDRNREYLRKWLPWVDSIKEVENARKFIYSSTDQNARNDGFQAGIWYKGDLVGIIGFHFINWSNKLTSIGYWLDEEFQGKGIMTKACKALINHSFEYLNLNRIEIRCVNENHKSRAIPERLGFSKEGNLRQAELLYDHYVDHIVYGLLKEDWNGEKI